MKKTIAIAGVSLALACQTHRTRHTVQQDSRTATTTSATVENDYATAQTSRRNWQQWLAESTAVVILPEGPVSYHPNHGFEGEATAIVTYRSADRRTATTHRQISQQRAMR